MKHKQFSWKHKDLRSMKACVMDISLQVDSIMDSIISEAHYRCLHSQREIIKEALEELNRIIVTNTNNTYE